MSLALTADYKFDLMDPSFRFDPEPHEYWLDGRTIPSTSAILAPWKSKFQPDPMYMHRGTIVHMACWYLDDGGLNEESVVKEYRGYVQGYRAFKADWKFIPRLNEKPLYNPELLYGVTPDKDGSLTLPPTWSTKGDSIWQGSGDAIVELKTGAVYKWVALQTISQKITLQKWDAQPRKRRRFGVRLNVDGTYDVTEFFNDAVDIVVWKSMVVAKHAAPDYF